MEDTYKFTVEVDTVGEQNLRALAAEVQRLQNSKVQVTADGSQLKSILSYLKEIGGKKLVIPVEYQIQKQALAKLEKVKASLQDDMSLVKGKDPNKYYDKMISKAEELAKAGAPKEDVVKQLEKAADWQEQLFETGGLDKLDYKTYQFTKRLQALEKQGFTVPDNYDTGDVMSGITESMSKVDTMISETKTNMSNLEGQAKQLGVSLDGASSAAAGINADQFDKLSSSIERAVASLEKLVSLYKEVNGIQEPEVEKPKEIKDQEQGEVKTDTADTINKQTQQIDEAVAKQDEVVNKVKENQDELANALKQDVGTGDSSVADSIEKQTQSVQEATDKTKKALQEQKEVSDDLAKSADETVGSIAGEGQTDKAVEGFDNLKVAKEGATTANENLDEAAKDTRASLDAEGSSARDTSKDVDDAGDVIKRTWSDTSETQTLTTRKEERGKTRTATTTLYKDKDGNDQESTHFSESYTTPKQQKIQDYSWKSINNELQNVISTAKELGVEFNTDSTAYKDLAGANGLLDSLENIQGRVGKLGGAIGTELSDQINKALNDGDFGAADKLVSSIEDKMAKVQNAIKSFGTGDSIQKTINQATKQLGQFDNIDGNDLINKQKELVETLRSQKEEFSNAMKAGDVDGIVSAYDKLNETLSKVKTNMAQMNDPKFSGNIQNQQTEEINKEIAAMEKLNDQRTKMSKQLNNLGDTSKYTSNITDQANRIQQRLNNINNLNTDRAQAEIKELAEELSNLAQAATKADNQLASATGISKMQSRISKFINDNGKMGSDYKQKFRDLQDDLVDGITNADISKVVAKFNNLQQEIFDKGLNGKGFGQMVGERIKGQAADFISQYFSFQDIINYAQQIAQTVTQVDSALVELSKVSDASGDRLQQSFQKSAQTAQDYGGVLDEVINSTADWSRLGFSLDQSEQLAKVTQLYQNVGDDIDQETAQKSITSTLKGFQLDADQAENIVDKFNAVKIPARPYENANTVGNAS